MSVKNVCIEQQKFDIKLLSNSKCIVEFKVYMLHSSIITVKSITRV